MPAGKRPLDMPVGTGGRLAFERTPRCVEDADIGWSDLSGSDTDRNEGILLGILPSGAKGECASESGVGVSGVSGGDPGVGGVSAIFEYATESETAGFVVVYSQLEGVRHGCSAMSDDHSPS